MGVRSRWSQPTFWLAPREGPVPNGSRSMGFGSATTTPSCL